MATKEHVYDQQIAPLMEQIIAICKAHSINTHASFLLDDDMMATTHLPLDGDPVMLEMLRVAAFSRGNLDAFVINMARRVNSGRFDGSASVVLRAMKQEATDGKG
jgi:hypothetical protein